MECVPLKKKWKKLSLWDKIGKSNYQGFIFDFITAWNLLTRLFPVSKELWLLKIILLTPHRAEIQVWLSLLQQWTYREQSPFPFTDPFTLYFRLCHSSSAFCLSLFLVTIFPLVIPTALLFTSWSHFPFFSYPTACLHGTTPTGGQDRRGVCWLQQHYTLTNAGLLLPCQLGVQQPDMCWDGKGATSLQPTFNRAVLFVYLQVCVCLEGRRSE